MLSSGQVDEQHIHKTDVGLSIVAMRGAVVTTDGGAVQDLTLSQAL